MNAPWGTDQNYIQNIKIFWKTWWIAILKIYHDIITPILIKKGMYERAVGDCGEVGDCNRYCKRSFGLDVFFHFAVVLVFVVVFWHL